MSLSVVSGACLLLGLATCGASITLDISSTDSIKAAASTAAYGMVSYYKGNETGGTPGILPAPYYWWEAGAMFNSLINYWYYTGDSTYNEITLEALVFQAGPDSAYMPPNQTSSEGNDDQMFWGFAAMTAAEYAFPNPPADQPQWLALAQGVFNSQAARWDDANCNGGLRWQFHQWSSGWNYKNTPANGGLFNLASRLYFYTGNETYHVWADRIYDWLDGVGLVDSNYVVFDGTSIANGLNCTQLDHSRWTYNQGILLNGAAVMYKATNETKWKDRAQGLWSAAEAFFIKDVMFEACELPGSTPCDLDQQSFKAYLSRFMAASAKVAPFLYDQMKPYMQASAIAAAAQCDGNNNNVCGMKWTQGSQWDGWSGVGEQMAALEIIQSNLIQISTAPVTSTTGGTSQGDPNAGTKTNGQTTQAPVTVITTADKAGAGILTAIVLIGTLSGAWWLLTDD